MTTSPNDQLREELKVAITNVRAQIDIQAVSNHYQGSEDITTEAIAELQKELVQLESALANLA